MEVDNAIDPNVQLRKLLEQPWPDHVMVRLSRTREEDRAAAIERGDLAVAHASWETGHDAGLAYERDGDPRRFNLGEVGRYDTYYAAGFLQAAGCFPPPDYERER